MKFELLGSQEVYKGRAFTVRQDQLKTPDGRMVKFDIIGHIGSAIVIPVGEDGRIYFVRQYRHAAGMHLLELPAGTLEPDEDPRDCAAREVREETGMAAAEITEIGGFYLAPGYSTEYMRVYLAVGLAHDPLEADADEFLQVETLGVAEALALAENSQMPDAKTLAALLLARKHLARYLD